MIVTVLLADFVSGMLGFAMLLVSLFLILLILVQRGRGGGLTGALGGPGGQSAFGTKAGDLFTRITSFVALGWITLCAFTMWLLGPDTASQAITTPPAVSASPADGKTTTNPLIDLGERKTEGDKPSDGPGVELTPANPTTTPPATEETATEAPAAETPATETPATETPATETPATETPATETPATETPATEPPAAETPATEAPATPSVEPPADAPVAAEEAAE